jgi:hypothetical protein
LQFIHILQQPIRRDSKKRKWPYFAGAVILGAFIAKTEKTACNRARKAMESGHDQDHLQLTRPKLSRTSTLVHHPLRRAWGKFHRNFSVILWLSG